MFKVSVIGAGAWGTALARVAADKNGAVTIFAREKEVVESINSIHENKIFLPDIKLSSAIKATGNIEDITDSDFVLNVTPSQFFRSQLVEFKEKSKGAKLPHFIICSKGIENGTLKLMGDVFEEVTGSNNYSVLSGPSFAEEVAEKHYTTISVATKDEEAAKRIKEVMELPDFKVSINKDVVGTQLCGALKNVIAISCGVVKGLGFGENTKAATITQGAKEIATLALFLGGKRKTMLEPCGIGDLVLTCNSEKSRNFSFGFGLGQGKTPGELTEGKPQVVEGVATAKSVFDICRKRNINLELCNMIYKVVNGLAEPKEILKLI